MRFAATIILILCLLGGCSPVKNRSQIEGIQAVAQHLEILPDYSLHDIWVLTHIDHELVDSARLGIRGAPQYEFFVEEGRVQVFNGCNQGRGPFFIVEPGVMQLGTFSSTRMMCEDMTIENLLNSSFLGQRLEYQIDNMQLTLTNPEGRSITFKKVD